MTFTDVHMSRQKVPKSDFQMQFSTSKVILTDHLREKEAWRPTHFS